MSAQRPSQRYREVQVTTAAKDDLLILLLDGGVRFAEGGLRELQQEGDEDRAKRSEHLVRAQKIMLELMGALSPTIGEELYNKLISLYRFTMSRLFQGNVKSDAAIVEEGVIVMKQIRDIWKEAVAKAREEGLKTKPESQSGSSISVTG
ncbi:MAG: flagellar export chaperone FliS [Planctomycetota bacterium]